MADETLNKATKPVRGPYRLAGDQRQGWDIVGEDGHSVARLSGILIDGSSSGRHPGNIIRTRAQQEATARYVLAALENFAPM